MGIVAILERTPKRLRCSVPSRVDIVGHVTCLVDDFIWPSSAAEAPNIEVVVRELLMNAVVHGNRSEESRRVLFTVECIDDRRYRITVEDEGDGFDVNTVDTRLPDDPRQVRQRGFALVNALTTELAFNEKGNQVTAIVELEGSGGTSDEE
ncbi:MAG: ATP-binding protein [bacterium]|nr:ATP-binding protein [bacterium]